MDVNPAKSSDTKKKGDQAERKAREWLKQHGFRIVACNVHSRGGEVDIVAWQDDVLCFIEVRSRKTDRLIQPAATVGPIKQRRLIQTATVYLQQHFAHAAPPCRFDVISVVGYDDKACVHHVPGAFAMSVETDERGNPWRPC